MSQPQITILFGSDEFAIAGQASGFLNAFGDPTAAEMNTSRLDARLMNEDELHNAANAMPFMAAQRLVVLTAPSKRYSGADGHRRFTAFLDSLPPTTKLVILEPGQMNKKEREKELGWLLKWAQGSQGRAEARELILPRRRDMPAWIVTETREQGGAIEPGAAARLAEMVGEDTRQASGEITKLLTYVNDAHPIGLEDVEATSIVNAQGDIFVLLDSIATGDGKRAQRMLHQLLEENDPSAIFWRIVGNFRLLLMAREVLDEGGNQAAVVEALGVHPYTAQKVYSQAQAFRMPALEATYRRLLRMDEDAKTSQVSLDLALDLFIAQTDHR